MTAKLPALSVVIPAINEEEALSFLLEDLRKQRGIELEVLVGDGGSTDRTREIAGKHGATVVVSPAGRAVQMNTAAREARGDYILFLHADSRLPESKILCEAVAYLQGLIGEAGREDTAGHFQLRFLRDRPGNSAAYAFLEAKSALNRENTTNGDQGFLMRTSFFRKLGGFDESLPFLEDQRLAERIREYGTWVTLPGVLSTSARRFEKDGFTKRYVMMAITMGVLHAGFTDFFVRTRKLGLYSLHATPEILLVTPLFDLIARMLRGSSSTDRCRFWRKIGRYVCRNAWQVFFLADVRVISRMKPGRRWTCLDFYDRVVGRVMEFPIFPLLTSVLTFMWFQFMVRPWYRFTEKQYLKRIPGGEASEDPPSP